MAQGIGASRLREIGRSWLSMKPWVKAWLFFLSGVFLAALCFRDPLASWALVAYLASGPLLLAMMLAQRGLTRLLGLAHLVPWTPFLVYAVLRLVGETMGPRIRWSDDPALLAWAALLAASLAVPRLRCLRRGALASGRTVLARLARGRACGGVAAHAPALTRPAVR